jgi:hypothetical protein
VKKTNAPFLECGKVFNPILPLQLSRKDVSVKLAQVTLNFDEMENPCLLITFSCFITSILRGERFNDLVFALVKSCDEHSRPEVIKVWPFRRVFEADMNTKEPVVFAYCDCISTEGETGCTYTMELVRAHLSEQSSYDITNKILTAQVFNS